MKRQATERENIFAKQKTDKQFVSGIYKEFLQRNKANQLKNGQERFEQTLSKEDI